MWPSRVNLLLGLFASASACSLTTSLDGLTGGAQSDAGTADGTVADAGGLEADGPSGPFCATTSHVFCADFDEGKPVNDGWDFTEVCTRGCALAVDTSGAANAPSPPGALHATTPTAKSAYSGANVLQAGLYRRLGDVTESVHVSVRLRVDALDTKQHTAQLVQLVFTTASGNGYSVELIATSAGAFVQEDINPLDGGAPSFPNTPLQAGLVLGHWTQVDLVFQLGSPSTLAVRFDGASVGTLQLDPTAHGGTFTVAAELAYYVPETIEATSVFYDNFAVDIP